MDDGIFDIAAATVVHTRLTNTSNRVPQSLHQATSEGVESEDHLGFLWKQPTQSLVRCGGSAIHTTYETFL